LTELTDLDLSECKQLRSKPRSVKMTTRKQVTAYQELIKKAMQ
jgi:hypothetical protein